MQIRTTQNFAKDTNNNPFVEDIEDRISEIAPHVVGLVGRDVQRAIQDVTTRKKARPGSKITPEELIEELEIIRNEKGIIAKDSKRLGPLGQLLFRHQS